MQRKQDGLVPVQKIRDASPQALHRFTQADQVNQLVSASEADPDLGFMARTMALCSLPRSNPGNRLRYVRHNGPYTLVMTSGFNNKLPYGNLPRLLLAWVTTEAVRTQSRELILGDSLSDFMRELGVYSSSGGKHIRMRNQMRRLFNAHVQLIYKDERGEARVSSSVANRTEFWWNPRRPEERSLWESKIELGEKFFNEILRHPVPIDMNTAESLEALFAGPRFVPMGGLPDVQFEAPDAALLADALPSVRRGPAKGERQTHRGQLPHGLPARVEEAQARLARPELLARKGRPDALTLNAFDYFGGRVATAGPIALQEAPGEPQRGGGFGEGRDGRILWEKSRQPTSWTQTGRSLRPSTAAPCFRYAGSSSTSLSRWTTPIRRARNASGTAVRGGR